MFSKDEEDYLNKIPLDKKVKIFSFDENAPKIVEEIIFSINKIYPDLEVKHMGASALEISGQNDIDIYAFSNPKNFYKYTPGLIKLFGKPKNKHKTFVEWKFRKEGYDIEFYLTDPNSKTMKRQIRVFETLKNNRKLLKEYEELKQSLDRKSFKEYQKRKYEFYHRIIDKNI